MASDLQKDARGFFKLPQRPEQAGYYAYGTPGGGAAQFAHPRLLTLLNTVEFRWQAIDPRRFGIGNISQAGGPSVSDHKSHTSGLDVDIRLLRKDGASAPVTRFDAQYDYEATAKLINLFFESHLVKVIYCNDLRISGVQYASGHDNHFHVTIKS